MARQVADNLTRQVARVIAQCNIPDYATPILKILKFLWDKLHGVTAPSVIFSKIELVMTFQGYGWTRTIPHYNHVIL